MATRVSEEERREFIALAKRVGLPPGTLMRYMMDFAVRLSKEIGDDEQFLYVILAEHGKGGEGSGEA